MKKKRILVLIVSFLLLFFSGTGLFAADADEIIVDRDDKGVWFIKGPDTTPLYDIFKAMGHAIATDRLWQMELYRRTATGRMAELFGEVNEGGFVETDKFMRTLGYSAEELEAAFNALDQDSQDVISGYVAGINQRIDEIKETPALLPFEFAAIQYYTPEVWTTSQIMAWSATMQRNFDPEALDTGQLDNAALLTRLSESFGPETAFAMFNDLRWTNDPSAPSVIDYAPKPGWRGWCSTNPGLKVDAKSVAAEMKAKNKRIIATLEEANARVKMGSYAWVLSGDKTKSGNPVLYSGPQMGFSVPSIVVEGSIQAGGLNISGMSVPGLPGIVIGRTPHHAWSMQVGHAHTTDYYFEHPSNVSLHRVETIKVLGGADVDLPIYRSSHGPIVSPLSFDPASYNMETEGPIVSWKYSQWDYEFASIGGYLKLAKATSMDQFGEGIREIAVSQHFCYADKDGNIAYWMSGRDPVRPEGEWRLPQGTLDGIYNEWDASELLPMSTDRNTPRGWYAGWNNKSNAGYPGGFNGYYTQYGPFHRTHMIYDYLDKKLKGHKKLGFNKIRDLALYIATTDSFYKGGNPWQFVKKDFCHAVIWNGITKKRYKALKKLIRWDGHFVEGGKSEWVAGTNRAEAWVLMDQWIDEVIKMTFADELGLPDDEGEQVIEESYRVLFNVLLHGLEYPGSLTNNYDWFQNLTDASAPQTASKIIVAALDKVLDEWSELPAETFDRGYIEYEHDFIGLVWQTPQSSRSTYAHCVEYGENGPVRIESMFPLGESGMLWIDPSNPMVPTPDPDFFSMTPEFDSFQPRPFPLF